jgi:hypothetical protein
MPWERPNRPGTSTKLPRTGSAAQLCQIQRESLSAARSPYRSSVISTATKLRFARTSSTDTAPEITAATAEWRCGYCGAAARMSPHASSTPAGSPAPGPSARHRQACSRRSPAHDRSAPPASARTRLAAPVPATRTVPRAGKQSTSNSFIISLQTRHALPSGRAHELHTRSADPSAHATRGFVPLSRWPAAHHHAVTHRCHGRAKCPPGPAPAAGS